MGRSIWILYDQLNARHPGIRSGSKQSDRVVLVEPQLTDNGRCYHRKKLVLLYSAMRHFAAELRSAGWEVDYFHRSEEATYSSAWNQILAAGGSGDVVLVEPNNYDERERVLAAANEVGLNLSLLPPFQFLVGRDEFREWAAGRKSLRMEEHYRQLRKQLEVLVEEDGEPSGGRWNFDTENRKTFAAWNEQTDGRTPTAPRVEPDEVTREVMKQVDSSFPKSPGESDGFSFPVDRAGARQWLESFLSERLPHFGDYQDVMVAGEGTLFHSVLSPLLNVGLLLPRECIDGAEKAYYDGRAPLAAVEGFIRQILGWREFVNGVYWLKMPDYLESNALQADRRLPKFFWTGETDMNCLRLTLGQAIETGYTHHIQRLMVLGNFLLLASVKPREAFEWFMEMYVDAHDWVMAANVFGMALHADGGYIASKPYAASGAYISKMSNYCSGCTYDPNIKEGKGACPFNLLYWAFFERHQDLLVRNPRTSMVVRSWRRRRPAAKKKILREAEECLRQIEEL